jgi:hypothetical protein
MEYKKYAPLLGKKLTEEILDKLIKSIRDDVRKESKSYKKGKKVASVPSEHDGA